MREILFRGKPKNEADYEFLKKMYKDNCKNGFIYGSLVVSHGKYYICVTALCQVNSLVNNGRTTMFEVFPETVGECTGLRDKNGKRIFEGDIVKTETYLWHGENKKERVARIGFVVYDEKFCQFGIYIKNFSSCFILHRWKGDSNEVIGNIHDNPELLK